MARLTPTFNGIRWEVPQIIPNATILPYPQNGLSVVPDLLRITANEGYVLHDKDADTIDFDDEGNPFTVCLRYATGTKSCSANYNFTPTEMTAEGLTVIAYGSREFFAIPRTAIPDPENQIFGGGTVTPPVEVMGDNGDENDTQTV